MAEIIGRMALSHGPQLIMPPERWQDLPHRLDLEPDVRPELETDLSEEVKASRFQRCMDAMAFQRKVLDEWKPEWRLRTWQPPKPTTFSILVSLKI